MLLGFFGANVQIFDNVEIVQVFCDKNSNRQRTCTQVVCARKFKVSKWLTGNPDHGGQTDHETKHFTPNWVMVVTSIGDRGVLDEIEQEDKNHESWSNNGPA